MWRSCRLLSWPHSGFLYCRFFLTSLYHRQNSLAFKKWLKGYAIRLWGMRICGDEASTCQLQPHRLNTSHIYNLNMRTVHRCLIPLGQVNDSPLEFYVPWTGWGLRTVQVLFSWSGFVRDWPTLTRLSTLCYRAFSSESVQHEMWHEQGWCHTLYNLLTHNPFSHINFVFQVLFYSTAWVIKLC